MLAGSHGVDAGCGLGANAGSGVGGRSGDGSGPVGGGDGAAGLQLVDARVGGHEALTQLLVLLVQAAQLDDDLVEEVVDLVLVVALAELGRVEPLVDHVFRSQSHDSPRCICCGSSLRSALEQVLGLTLKVRVPEYIRTRHVT